MIDDEADLCGTCDGSGEGMCDGAICQHCKGTGVEPRKQEELDPPDDWVDCTDDAGPRHYAGLGRWEP